MLSDKTILVGITGGIAAYKICELIRKFKKAGAKPFILAFLLYIWLLAGGWALSKYIAPLFL